MVNGSGVSRGDRNRNARLARLRERVPLENAIVGIDLANNKEMVVVTDHDSKVLARKTFRCWAWDLGVALDWAAERASAKGFAGVTLSCEPSGHRWRVLGQLTVGWMALFVIGCGLYAVRIGVTARRGERVWLRRATADSRPGFTGAVALAGMFGALGQLFGGGAFWPGMVGGLCGVAVGIVASWRRWSGTDSR